MKHLFNSLPAKLLLGVAVGIAIGLGCSGAGSTGDAIMQVVLTIKTLLGSVITFCVPLIIIGFIAANILMGLIGMVICRQVIKITKVSDAILIPVIVVLSTIGSFAINNRMSDVYMMLFFGFLGYWARKLKLPTAPIILGLLLEKTGEEGFKNAILMAKSTPIWKFYLTRPASLVLIVLIIVTVVVPAVQSVIKAVKKEKAA